MKNSAWHMCVLVPARNEEELLPRCLGSIVAAQALLPAKVSCDIIVTADRSVDNTKEIAERVLGRTGAVVTSEGGIVGHARALAAQVALQRYQGPLNRCWFANTDADCRVPESWLADQLLLAINGVEAFAGTVDVDTFIEHNHGVEALFRSSYVIHPDGTHPHVHGANFGVRADAYVRAGGWANLCTAEDHDLWNRLARSGAKRVSVAGIKVLTSGRRIGRAPHGFADALAVHNEVAAQSKVAV